MTGLLWRGWLVAAAIFVFGAVVGGTGAALLGIRVFRQAMRAPQNEIGPADRAAARIGADLTESLHLTAEESARVQALLDQSASRLKAVRMQAAASAVAELRASTEKIAQTLPPEKRAEYYRVVARRFERLGVPPPVRNPSP